MAEDIVMPWLTRLREAKQPEKHLMVTDRHLLLVAETLGSIDPDTLEARSPNYRGLDTVSDSQVVSILDGIMGQVEG